MSRSAARANSVELARALLLGFEQPRVLDRDHRLVGKGRHQLDLLLGKRVDLVANQREHADRGAVAQQRHAEVRSVAERLLIFGRSGIRDRRARRGRERPCPPMPHARSRCFDPAAADGRRTAPCRPKIRRSSPSDRPRRRAETERLCRRRKAGPPNSTSVDSTFFRSKVERLMTLSTSAVAVCWASDSRNSLSSRVFSMAMTAWAAKFLTRSIWRSVNGSTRWRESPNAPIASPRRSSGTPRIVLMKPSRAACWPTCSLVSANVGYLNRTAFRQRSADGRPAAGCI